MNSLEKEVHKEMIKPEALGELVSALDSTAMNLWDQRSDTVEAYAIAIQNSKNDIDRHRAHAMFGQYIWSVWFSHTKAALEPDWEGVDTSGEPDHLEDYTPEEVINVQIMNEKVS